MMFWLIGNKEGVERVNKGLGRVNPLEGLFGFVDMPIQGLFGREEGYLEIDLFTK